MAKPDEYTADINLEDLEDYEEPDEDLDAEDLDEDLTGELDDDLATDLDGTLDPALDPGLDPGLDENLEEETLDEEEEEEDLEEDAELDEEEEEEEEALDVILARDTGLDEELGRLDDEPRDGLFPSDAPISAGEFTCRSCFLVKRRPQLADPERMICLDCI